MLSYFDTTQVQYACERYHGTSLAGEVQWLTDYSPVCDKILTINPVEVREGVYFLHRDYVLFL